MQKEDLKESGRNRLNLLFYSCFFSRFKLTNEQFLRVMQLQDRIQEEFDRVVIQNPNFSAINAELTSNLKIILEKHIDRSVTRHFF